MNLRAVFAGDPRIPQAVADEIDQLLNEFKALQAADAPRLARFSQYRAENEESRTKALQAAVGESGTGNDYGNRSRRRKPGDKPERHRISVPLGRAATVKHAHRIAGRLPDCVVDRRGENPQERHRSQTMEKIVWGIHRHSNGDSEFAAAAWDSSELGAGCFEIEWDRAAQKPRYRSVDPASVVVVRGVTDPHDFQRVYRYWRAPVATVISDYREQTFRGQPVAVDKIRGKKDDTTEWTTIVQVKDKRRCLRFTLDEGVPLYEDVHGLSFTPFVVIPNLGPEREVWGWSDYEQVRALGHYIPKNLSREADILRATANGAYTMEGSAKVSTEQANDVLEQGGILHVGREGSLTPVKTPEVPAFAEAHAERALKLFEMVGFLPPASWGEGGANSGSDRGLQLGPHLEYTAMKQVNWAAGLTRLFSMAFRMIERNQIARATYSGVARTRTGKADPFSLTLGPDPKLTTEQPAGDTIPNPDFQADVSGDGSVLNADSATIFLPRTPKELFQGDYTARFLWKNRVDPDDPAFVASEINKFVQGAQSLETTLERLGIEAPEDEMQRIEQESTRFPWINQGRIRLLQAMMSQQGGGSGGRPVDPGSGVDDAAAAFGDSTSTAQDGNIASSALPGSVPGPLYG